MLMCIVSLHAFLDLLAPALWLQSTKGTCSSLYGMPHASAPQSGPETREPLQPYRLKSFGHAWLVYIPKAGQYQGDWTAA